MPQGNGSSVTVATALLRRPETRLLARLPLTEDGLPTR